MTITNLVNLARFEQFGALRPNVINDNHRTNKVGQIFGDNVNVNGNGNTIIINRNNNNDSINGCCQGGQQNRMMARMLQMFTQMFGGIMQLFGQMIGNFGNFNQFGNNGSYASLLNCGLQDGWLI